MQRAFESPTAASKSLLHEGSLEYQFQHLSPLDAFKARGKYLHDQLKRQGNQSQDVRKAEIRNSHRSSLDSVDAFSLDYKLQSRKSSLPWPAEERTPSIRSEQVDLDTVSLRPSVRTLRSSTSSSLLASETSTIRAPGDSDADSWSHQRELDHSDVTNTQQFNQDPVSFAQSSLPRLVQSRSSTSRSQTPSELTNSPDHASILSSPSSSVYSVHSSYMREKEASSQTPDSNPSFRMQFSSQHISTRSRSENKPVEGNELPRVSVTPSALPAHKTSPIVNKSDGRPLGPLLSPSNSPLSYPTTPDRTLPQSGRSLSYGTPSHSQTVNGSAKRPSIGGLKSSLGRSNTRNASIKDTRVASMPDAALSAAMHIELGIEQHEANQLPQSTHHFKVAADMGDPTGCLLYGLSLRHGWGIRPDLQRSIQMLQKAADTVTSLNVDTLRSSKLMERQVNEDLAIAIYELGVSYKNGWGVVADKKLSLKYFELATSWGDVEAMVEAAECYLHGTGCKKDKAKAAKYLRMAESKGKKEIGNSWIWKSKYDGP